MSAAAVLPQQTSSFRTIKKLSDIKVLNDGRKVSYEQSTFQLVTEVSSSHNRL